MSSILISRRLYQSNVVKLGVPILLILGVIISIFFYTKATPSVSELAFIEHSNKGKDAGSVIPASCNSSPPVSHFPGDCVLTPPPYTGSCPLPGSTATLTWAPVYGATYYALRVNNVSTGGWNGSCNASAGDFCQDIAGFSRTVATVPGHTYNTWVHSCNSSGCSATASHANFTCPVPTPVVTITPSVHFGGVGYTTALYGEYHGIYGGQNYVSWSANNGANSCSVYRGGALVGTYAYPAVTAYYIPSSQPIYGTTQFTVSCSNGTYSGNQSVTFTVPPRQSGLTYSCSSDATSVTVSWNQPPGYGWSYARLQDGVTGNIIYNNEYGGSSIQYPIVPGRTYSFWSHTEAWSGAFSQEVSASIQCIPPPPTVSATLNPTSITSGQTTSVGYSSTGATACWNEYSGDGTNFTSVPISIPSYTWNPAGPYTLASWPNGVWWRFRCQNAVGVERYSNVVHLTITPPPSMNITLTPNPITDGSTATFGFTSANANRCEVRTSSNGTNFNNVLLSSSLNVTARTWTNSGPYTLASFPNGVWWRVTCWDVNNVSTTEERRLTINPSALGTPPTVSFAANPTNITSGNSSLLSWTVTGASTCTASGGWSGAKNATGGSQTVSPVVTTTYGLECRNALGASSGVRTVTVNVSTPSAPNLSFGASPSIINSGNSSTLTWQVTGQADACWASGGWSGWKSYTGLSTQQVNPTANTTYSLECWNQGVSSGKKDATVTVISGASPVLNTTGCTILSGQSRCTIPTSSVINPGPGKSYNLKNNSSGVTTNNAFTSTNGYIYLPTGAGTAAELRYGLNTLVIEDAVAVGVVLSSSNVFAVCDTGTTWVGGVCTASGGGSAPTANITSPAGNRNALIGEAIPVNVVAGDVDGDLVSLQLSWTGPGDSGTCESKGILTFSGTCVVGTVMYSGLTITPTIIPRAAGVYQITAVARDAQGNTFNSTSRTITVSTPSGTAPNVNLSVGNANPPYNTSTDITWSVGGGTPDTCTASGDWSGSKSILGGTESTGPLTSSRTYTLTCSGTGGSDTKSVIVTPTGGPAITEFKVCDPGETNCVSSGTKYVTTGSNHEVHWTSSNTVSCSRVAGPADFTTGNLPTGVDSSITASTVSNTTVDYRIACQDASGNPVVSNTIRVSTNANNPTLSASETMVGVGGITQLRWNTNGNPEGSCSLTGGSLSSTVLSSDGTSYSGPEDFTGFLDVVVNGKTTYTLTCGLSNPSSVTINVRPTGYES